MEVFVMDEKELKELVKSCSSLIEERSELIIRKVANMKEYKQKYALYSKIFQD